MKRCLIGIVLASVVLYAFGFVWWGMGPYQDLIWKQAVDEDAARADPCRRCRSRCPAPRNIPGSNLSPQWGERSKARETRRG